MNYYFNAGSVVIAICTPGLVQCMALESNGDKWTRKHLLVPCDNRKVAKDCIELGLMDYAPWFISSNIQILLSGWDNSSRMVKLANDIELNETGACEWPYIEEEYFEKAAYIFCIPDYRKSVLFVNK